MILLHVSLFLVSSLFQKFLPAPSFPSIFLDYLLFFSNLVPLISPSLPLLHLSIAYLVSSRLVSTHPPLLGSLNLLFSITCQNHWIHRALTKLIIVGAFVTSRISLFLLLRQHPPSFIVHGWFSAFCSQATLLWLCRIL